jgi:hypothetical protein
MQHAGLDINDALTLASKCPWADKEFSVVDLQVPPSAKGPKPLPPVSQPQLPAPTVPQRQPQQEFVAADEFDIPGGDYRVEIEVQLDLCASLCRSEAQCRAYTYNKTARWCFLKDRVDEAQRFVGAFRWHEEDRADQRGVALGRIGTDRRKGLWSGDSRHAGQILKPPNL